MNATLPLDEIRRFADVGGFCSTRKLADFLGQSPAQVRKLCYEGQLRFVKTPGRQNGEILVQRASVIEMFERESDGTNQATPTEGAGRNQEATRQVLSLPRRSG